MHRNQNMVRSTLCANPTLAEHIQLHAFGLGQKKSRCYIFSGDINLVCEMHVVHQVCMCM